MTDEDAVMAVLEELGAATRARDAGAVTRLYAEDAWIADLAPPLLHEGTDPVGLQAWFDGWDAPVETEHRDLRIELSGDLALVSALQRTSTRRGGEDAAWWARVTLGLRRGLEGWRVFHLHESVPFHMDGSFRAAIDLEP
jgi:ketosteroid isomerase-like protein